MSLECGTGTQVDGEGAGRQGDAAAGTVMITYK